MRISRHFSAERRTLYFPRQSISTKLFSLKHLHVDTPYLGRHGLAVTRWLEAGGTPGQLGRGHLLQVGGLDLNDSGEDWVGPGEGLKRLWHGDRSRGWEHWLELSSTDRRLSHSSDQSPRVWAPPPRAAWSVIRSTRPPPMGSRSAQSPLS